MQIVSSLPGESSPTQRPINPGLEPEDLECWVDHRKGINREPVKN